MSIREILNVPPELRAAHSRPIHKATRLRAYEPNEDFARRRVAELAAAGVAATVVRCGRQSVVRYIA